MGHFFSFATFIGKFSFIKTKLNNHKKPFKGIALLALAMPRPPAKDCPGGCWGWKPS